MPNRENQNIQLWCCLVAVSVALDMNRVMLVLEKAHF